MRYDTKEDADAASELVLLQQLGLHTHSEVVDLGAGTGQFALAAVSACARVVAVDVSLVMLQRLQAKINEAHLSNVEVVQSGFLTYEHRGRPVDFVYTRFALHHLPDFWKAVALARVRRIEAWCATGGSSVGGAWSRAELEEHVRDEHSTFRWLLEPMIERCGFAIEEAVYSPDGIFGKYVARAT